MALSSESFDNLGDWEDYRIFAPPKESLEIP
jgi:hypothetical protein